MKKRVPNYSFAQILGAILTCASFPSDASNLHSVAVSEIKVLVAAEYTHYQRRRPARPLSHKHKSREISPMQRELAGTRFLDFPLLSTA